MATIVQEIDMEEFRHQVRLKGFTAEEILEIQSALEESFVE